MGMYTEIYINVDLSIKTPIEVLNMLTAICENDHEYVVAQGKPLNWAYLFCDASCYLPKTKCAELFHHDFLDQWSLLGKGDLKNYNQEIEQFFTWIMPWVDASMGEFIGYQRYEENLEPKLYFKTKETFDENKILEVLKKFGPQDFNQIYTNINTGGNNFSEKLLKEAVLRLREQGIIKPNHQWKMEIVEK